MWHGLLGFVIGVLGVISVAGNGMVMYIFSSTKSLQTPSNLLVVNLAFSDFTMTPACHQLWSPTVTMKHG
jgi:r-opsin